MPAQWKANKKAWMDSSIFGEWLKDINNKMKRQKRKILLFIDNATSHPHLEFSNFELKLFPANCTSQLQPMDHGIIQSMKLSYRKLLLLDVLSSVDSCDSRGGSRGGAQGAWAPPSKTSKVNIHITVQYL